MTTAGAHARIFRTRLIPKESAAVTSINQTYSSKVTPSFGEEPKNANEVLGENYIPTHFSGSMELLPSISYYHLQDKQQDIFWEFYEQNHEELSKKKQQIFTECFMKFLGKAGGKDSHLPTYFSFQDETRSQKTIFVKEEGK